MVRKIIIDHYLDITMSEEQMCRHAVEIRPCWLIVYFLPENEDIAGKSFAFPEKNNIPMYYVSASNGTNVVKVSYSVH